jgi:hypothetical protein
MRATAVCLVAGSLAFLSACAGSTDAARQATADCSDQIRVDGVIYTGYGQSDRKPVPFATADRADCHDVGRNAPGSVFADSPQQVEAWRFDGYSPREVLAVPVDNNSYEVFFAESVSDDAIHRVLAELADRAD